MPKILNGKPWYESKAIIAGVGLLGLTLTIVLFSMLETWGGDLGRGIKAVEMIAKVAIPLLTGLGFIGIRQKQDRDSGGAR